MTTTFREGDKIEITMEVVKSYGQSAVVRIDGDSHDVLYSFVSGQLALGRRLPRSIGVGDKVRPLSWHSGLVFEVNAVVGNRAAISACVNGELYCLWHLLSDLTLAEEGTP